MSPATLALNVVAHEKRASDYLAAVDHLLASQRPGAMERKLVDSAVSKALMGAGVGAVGGGLIQAYRHRNDSPEESRKRTFLQNISGPATGAFLGADVGGIYGLKTGMNDFFRPLIGRDPGVLELGEYFHGASGADPRSAVPNTSLGQAMTKHIAEMGDAAPFTDKVRGLWRLLHAPAPQQIK